MNRPNNAEIYKKVKKNKKHAEKGEKTVLAKIVSGQFVFAC